MDTLATEAERRPKLYCREPTMSEIGLYFSVKARVVTLRDEVETARWNIETGEEDSSLDEMLSAIRTVNQQTKNMSPGDLRIDSTRHTLEKAQMVLNEVELDMKELVRAYPGALEDN